STKVYVKQMAGNHSGNMEFAFMEYLQAKYPQVVVHNNIKFRDAYLLDNVGIMLAHGDLAPKNLPMLFANEFGGVWSLSHSREIHKGHFHKEKTVDEGGVISRQLGTVKPNDKYEIMNGWTLSKKELYALEYDSDKLVAEWHV
ncbi:helix-turn-helix domain-containing protein, partial [Leuconostoc mesenteroides]|nr:helix-turn-helix domain-containing protein [Leuconostoc mesenteroides]